MNTPSTSNDGSLEDREARLRAILDTAVEGIVTISEQGLVETMNPAAERIFGYSQEEMLGRNVSQLMPQPYRGEHDQYLANYLKTGIPRIIGMGREVVGRRADGSTFPMHLSVSEVPLSTRRIFTGFVHDLSVRVAAQRQATRLGQILEDSLNEIYMFDAASLRFTNVNRGARDNLGYSMIELARMTPLDVMLDLDFDSFAEIVASLRSGKRRIVELEAIHRRADGSCYPVEIRLQLEQSQSDPAFVAIANDITEQRKFRDELERLVAERTEQLRTAQEELVRKERLAILGQLAGGVAHEIRNPLGVIRNATYFLRQVSSSDDEDISESFEEIERALLSSNQIVGELLDYAREPTTDRDATFEAHEALENAIRSLEPPADIEIRRSEPPTAWCRGDQGQVERILVNLMHNAIQAMPNGGALELGLETDDRFVEFVVSDTGVGIDDAHLQKIFDPLFTQKAKGIGLGLAISKRYAELNEGSIRVDSQPGCGSTFRLALPIVGDGKAANNQGGDNA